MDLGREKETSPIAGNFVIPGRGIMSAPQESGRRGRVTAGPGFSKEAPADVGASEASPGELRRERAAIS